MIRCVRCGNEWEDIQPVHEAVTCPSCGAGWYEEVGQSVPARVDMPRDYGRDGRDDMTAYWSLFERVDKYLLSCGIPPDISLSLALKYAVLDLGKTGVSRRVWLNDARDRVAKRSESRIAVVGLEQLDEYDSPLGGVESRAIAADLVSGLSVEAREWLLRGVRPDDRAEYNRVRKEVGRWKQKTLAAMTLDSGLPEKHRIQT